MPTDLAVSPRHLSLPECALFNPTELRISEDCSQDDFRRIGCALTALGTAEALWSCDLAYFATQRGDHWVAIASEATGIGKTHLKKRLARGAEVFPPARRFPKLKKTHYVKLIGFADQPRLHEWLKTVADSEHLSVRSLFVLAVTEFGALPKTQPPKKKAIHLREDLWARLAPHAPSRKISVLIELIIENWLQRPQTEQEIIKADLEQRRQYHNANQRAQNEKKKVERAAVHKAELERKAEARQAERERRENEKRSERDRLRAYRQAERERIEAARQAERNRKAEYREEQRLLHSETPEVGVRKYKSSVKIVFTECSGPGKLGASRYTHQTTAEAAAAEYSADRGYPVAAFLCDKCSGEKQVWHVK